MTFVNIAKLCSLSLWLQSDLPSKQEQITVVSLMSASIHIAMTLYIPGSLLALAAKRQNVYVPHRKAEHHGMYHVCGLLISTWWIIQSWA